MLVGATVAVGCGGAFVAGGGAVITGAVVTAGGAVITGAVVIAGGALVIAGGAVIVAGGGAVAVPTVPGALPTGPVGPCPIGGACPPGGVPGPGCMPGPGCALAPGGGAGGTSLPPRGVMSQSQPASPSPSAARAHTIERETRADRLSSMARTQPTAKPAIRAVENSGQRW